MEGLGASTRFKEFLQDNGLDERIYTDCPDLPRYIRVNPRFADTCMSDVERELGAKLHPVSWLPGFYTVSGDVGIAGCSAYKEGRIYGIDAASGAAVAALQLSPGDHVLDLCAAPGAKMCMIADILNGAGSVTAVDIAQPRIATCRTLALKYKSPNCRLFLGDGSVFSVPPPSGSTCEVGKQRGRKKRAVAGSGSGPAPVAVTEALPEPFFCNFGGEAAPSYSESAEVAAEEGGGRQHIEINDTPTGSAAAGDHAEGEEDAPRYLRGENDRDEAKPKCGGVYYDAVLVDAECTHDGSIKHLTKYDKWGWDTFERRFLDPERIRSVTNLQRRLLRNGLARLKPGGYLVYSTCSFTRAQNEDVVCAVLQETNGAAELVPIACGEEWPGTPGFLEHTLRFDPRHSNTSGLFVARILKRSNGESTEVQAELAS
ncbi:hypothetical protein CYMTET_25578 [Cymbomonas tetramitiformis]|uniref:SAM-dependent MTase RsmB/NOP-type domain-containing protein n=1 Tax=Cymbomonas tetramitiformis TaxID=36881 RepID=A0AAE0FU97_9CHLO|nr:hypothetical protein CYMTET_25578 [Cymbomonas tetramitiformis]|eukprot:gene2357-3086_t